jgi:hypothetical protein
LKLLEGSIGELLQGVGICNDFLIKNKIAQKIIMRFDKWDPIELKSFYTARKTMTRLTRQPKQRGKIFANYSPDRGLIPDYI